MSDTPMLTKEQQRRSLSAKKARPAKGLRNILAQPFENDWPTVNADQYPTLMTLINELLPSIKRPTFKIPGSTLRHTSKEKRILLRKEALEKEIKPDENILKCVILGINAITRALENNSVCCVLLDANVEPPLLIKHIVVMAQNKKIPVLLLPVLKAITLEKIGFAAAAFALKNDVMQSSENVFHALYKSIAEVAKDFEPSKRSFQLFKPDKTSEASEDCNLTSSIKKQEKLVVFTDVYKYRSSRKERTFVPSSASKSSQVSQKPSNEFIALSSDSDFADNKNSKILLSNKRYVNIVREKNKELKDIEEDNVKLLEESKSSSTNLSSNTGYYVPRKRKSTDDVTYLSLKVKRIQGNSNRKKATKFAKKKKK